MRKGITPIIAIIILLLITIALAGAAWAYLQGFLFSQISKTFVIPSGGAYCENGIISVYALNTGYDSTLVATPTTGGDFMLATADSIDVMGDLVDATLSEGTAGLIFRTDCDAVAGVNPPAICAAGYHTVRLGTQSTIVDPRLSC